jgi:hypothetical protein
MNDSKTLSMLQRIPMILAVTAASYGLPMQAQSAPARTASKYAISRSSATTQTAPQPRLMQQR